MNNDFEDTTLHLFVTSFCNKTFGNRNCFYVKLLKTPLFVILIIPVIVVAIVLDFVYYIFK